MQATPPISQLVLQVCSKLLDVGHEQVRLLGARRPHAASCACGGPTFAVSRCSEAFGERIPSEECRRSWLYSSIQAGIRRQAWSFVVKWSPQCELHRVLLRVGGSASPTPSLRRAGRPDEEALSETSGGPLLDKPRR
jgi:hypothetical protein